MIRMILGSLLLLPVVLSIIAFIRRPVAAGADEWVPFLVFAVVGTLLVRSGWRAHTRPGPRCATCRGRLSEQPLDYATVVEREGVAGIAAALADAWKQCPQCKTYVHLRCADREVLGGFTYSKCPGCATHVNIS